MAFRRSCRWTSLAAVMALAACTEYWGKPGGTSAEFEATKAACTSQAYEQFAPNMRQVEISRGYTTPMQTNCTGFGNSVNCSTTGGQYMPSVYVPIDMNEGQRNGASRSCLIIAGWQPVKDRDEARALNNTAPSYTQNDPEIHPLSHRERVAASKAFRLIDCRTHDGIIVTTKGGCQVLRGIPLRERSKIGTLARWEHGGHT